MGGIVQQEVLISRGLRKRKVGTLCLSFLLFPPLSFPPFPSSPFLSSSLLSVLDLSITAVTVAATNSAEVRLLLPQPFNAEQSLQTASVGLSSPYAIATGGGIHSCEVSRTAQGWS